MSLFTDDDDYPRLYDAVLGHVRHVFLTDWDPIGVSDVPTCYDEYDEYAPGIATMLMHGVKDEVIDQKFRDVLNRMGLLTTAQLRRAVELRVRLRRDAADIVAGMANG